MLERGYHVYRAMDVIARPCCERGYNVYRAMDEIGHAVKEATMFIEPWMRGHAMKEATMFIEPWMRC